RSRACTSHGARRRRKGRHTPAERKTDEETKDRDHGLQPVGSTSDGTIRSIQNPQKPLLPSAALMAEKKKTPAPPKRSVQAPKRRAATNKSSAGDRKMLLGILGASAVVLVIAA